MHATRPSKEVASGDRWPDRGRSVLFVRRMPAALLVAVLLAFVAIPTARAAATYSISGSLYNDDIGDGHRDPGDRLFTGMCNAILDAGADGANVQGLDVHQGTFSFTGLEPGHYRLSAQCEYSNGYPPGLYSATATTGRVEVDVTTSSLSGIDLGFFVPPSLFGQVFADENADGIRQSSEVGINGCRVNLDRGLDGTIDDGGDTHTGSTNDIHGARIPGIILTTLNPGRYHLDASCPGLGAPTMRLSDLVAHSGVDIGGTAATPGELPIALFGFDPTPVTTTRGAKATTSTTAGAAATSSTVAAGTSSSSSSSTSTATGLALDTTSSDGGNGAAVGVAIGAVALAGAAIAVAVLRRRGRLTD
jgi:hypothetical protein